MGGTLKRLFGMEMASADTVSLGEDMAPSPHALAERTALRADEPIDGIDKASGPFASAAQAPMRDFTG